MEPVFTTQTEEVVSLGDRISSMIQIEAIEVEDRSEFMDDEDFLALFFKVYGDVNQDVNR